MKIVPLLLAVIVIEQVGVIKLEVIRIVRAKIIAEVVISVDLVQ